MATIGSILVNLGLSSAAFTAGINKARHDTNSFGASISSFATGTMGLMTGALAAVGVGLSVNSFANWIGGTMEAMDATAKLSDRLGISTEALVGLQHGANLADVSTEELTGGLEKMLKNLGAAAQGTGTAVDALSQMGLSATNLANMSPDAAFKQIADGLVAINNPAQRAKAAVDLFGKSGQSLLPLLMEGSQGIAAAQAEAEKLGLTFSGVDAEKIKAANDAMKKIGDVITGIGQKITIELSPYITAAADAAVDFAGKMDFGQLAINSIEWTVTAIAKMTDWLSAGQAAWDALKGTGLMAAGALVGSIGGLLSALDSLLAKLGIAETGLGQTLMEAADKMGTAGEKAMLEAGGKWDDFMKGKNSKAATEFFAGIRSGAQAAAQAIEDAKKKPGDIADDFTEQLKSMQKAQDLIKGLEDSVATFGMSGGEKKLLDLSALGVSADDFNKAKAAIDQLGALEAQKKMMDDGKQLADSMASPLEKYQGQIEKFQGMLEAGAIDQETFFRAAGKAQDDLRQGMGGDQLKLASAHEQRFAFTYRAEKKGFDPMLDMQKLTLEEAKKQREAAVRTADILTKSGSVVLVDIDQAA